MDKLWAGKMTQSTAMERQLDFLYGKSTG